MTECRYFACHQRTRRSRFFCDAHWDRVPKDLRNNIQRLMRAEDPEKRRDLEDTILKADDALLRREMGG